MGRAANDIRNIACELESLAPEDEFICVVPQEQVDTVRGLARNLQVIGTPVLNDSYLRRLWFDQAGSKYRDPSAAKRPLLLYDIESERTKPLLPEICVTMEE
jgi:hypothetical protein